MRYANSESMQLNYNSRAPQSGVHSVRRVYNNTIFIVVVHSILVSSHSDFVLVYMFVSGEGWRGRGVKTGHIGCKLYTAVNEIKGLFAVT